MVDISLPGVSLVSFDLLAASFSQTCRAFLLTWWSCVDVCRRRQEARGRQIQMYLQVVARK